MVSNGNVNGALILLTMLITTTPAVAQIRADKIEQRAALLHAQPARYSEAAWLYREAAALRAPTDPRAVAALARAAHLYGYAQRYMDARRLMEEAAERALKCGDIARASQASLDAAFFAEKDGKQGHVERLAREALELADSPAVDAAERDVIHQRVRSTPTMVGVLDAFVRKHGGD